MYIKYFRQRTTCGSHFSNFISGIITLRTFVFHSFIFFELILYGCKILTLLFIAFYFKNLNRGLYITSFSLFILSVLINIKIKLATYKKPITIKNVLNVIWSVSPIFDMMKNTRGIKNNSMVHVISKLIKSLPSLSLFFILPFFDVQSINGIKIPNNGKNRNVNADKLRYIKYFLSSFTDQSINSSGITFKAFAKRFNDSPVGLDSPFSILCIVLKLNPDSSARNS
ncbi:hypothetical protein I602_2660 [Polaribacter dokdonensis DSW-5]|uniref:Uncharacterized protein n=1 Tax=Polaribacter dokdonensis DSW-5 TaxID=1300348 RepID=A0A0N0CGC0_9FLAO|nr:hypothetical protein I602_2660 [Polaribacter dokdonensis DSW-5]